MTTSADVDEALSALNNSATNLMHRWAFAALVHLRLLPEKRAEVAHRLADRFLQYGRKHRLWRHVDGLWSKSEDGTK